MGGSLGCDMCQVAGNEGMPKERLPVEPHKEHTGSGPEAGDRKAAKGTIDFLAKVQLFKRLPVDQLPVLANSCIKESIPQGQCIIKQGDDGNEFFVIMSGVALVLIDSNEVAQLKAGDYFGENALLRNEARTATIQATCAMDLLKISRERFESLGLHQKLIFPTRRAVGGGGAQNVKTKPPDVKTLNERTLIHNAIKSNSNLQAWSNLTENQCNQLIEVAWKETISAGTAVIKENDLDADCFYIVQDGLFEVFTEKVSEGQSAEEAIDNSQTHEKVGVVSTGGSFGELALLYFAPRAATVKAKTNSLVWVIDRVNFKNILAKSVDDMVAEHAKHLEKVEIFNPLKREEKLAIAKALTDCSFSQGETIFEEGETGAEMYILLEGAVSVTKQGQEVARIEASENNAKIFGELALKDSAPRAATIKITSPTAKALSMDKTSFEMLLGPLDHIFQRGTGAPSMLKSVEAVVKQDAGRIKIHHKDLKQLGLLGCGGFGAVSLVEHQLTKDTYALKALSKGYVVKCGMQKAIMSEKSIQYMCQSDFIIRLYECFNTADSLLLLLELALGGELYATYNLKGFFGSLKHAQFYAAGVIFAFTHLHDKKVIFRDLKPENVLLNERGEVKLTDMGLAKIVVGKTYTTCGTPDYFAPEVIKSEGHNQAVDWWTLGVLIFELMSGHPPFESSSPMQTYAKINKGITKVSFPSKTRGVCEELIKGLCKPCPSERLPMKKGGVDNLKKHTWFKGFDFAMMADHSLDPPYKPQVKSRTDPSNFHARAEDMPPQIKYQDDGTGWDTDFATST